MREAAIPLHSNSSSSCPGTAFFPFCLCPVSAVSQCLLTSPSFCSLAAGKGEVWVKLCFQHEAEPQGNPLLVA